MDWGFTTSRLCGGRYSSICGLSLWYPSIGVMIIKFWPWSLRVINPILFVAEAIQNPIMPPNYLWMRTLAVLPSHVSSLPSSAAFARFCDTQTQWVYGLPLLAGHKPFYQRALQFSWCWVWVSMKLAVIVDSGFSIISGINGVLLSARAWSWSWILAAIGIQWFSLSVGQGLGIQPASYHRVTIPDTDIAGTRLEYRQYSSSGRTISWNINYCRHD